jgi:hypothetical protein
MELNTRHQPVANPCMTLPTRQDTLRRSTDSTTAQILASTGAVHNAGAIRCA